MVNLLIALVVLFAAIALCIGTLLILRQMRLKKKEQDALMAGDASLPMYSEKDASTSHLPLIASSSRHSRLVISTHSPVFNEKEALMRGVGSPISPDVPEIRITFPEEVDEAGKRTSGRVVIVKVGEHSVGLEPVRDSEELPAYRQQENSRFESLDLDRMGGLKEKDMR
jgi:hypothetical protein